MQLKNYIGETLFQIGARLPKTRKDEFVDYLKEVKKRNELQPIEREENIVKEAGQ